MSKITLQYHTVIIAFILIAVLVLFFNTKIKRQKGVIVTSNWVVLAEITFDFFSSIVSDTIGENKVKQFTPLAMTIFLSIFISNSLVLIGFQEAATDIMFPITLSLGMFIFWNIYGIYKIGIKKFIKDFFQPSAFMFPIEVIGFLTKPITLMIRMFGNISSGFIMMGVVMLVPKLLGDISIYLGIIGTTILVPIIGMLSFYFSVFSPFIQALVFTYLVFVNIGLLINEEE